MKERITKSQFTFVLSGAGLYQVIYQSDYDRRKHAYWFNVITDMELIDATKGTDYAKIADLLALRRAVKRGRRVVSQH